LNFYKTERVLTKVGGKRSDNHRDGRLTVVLVLAFCLILVDLDDTYKWFSSVTNTSSNSSAQLQVLQSNRMTVNELLPEAIGKEQGKVPVAYTPFFFQPVPINIADKEMLMTIKGVGPALAQSILDYRNQRGPFRNMEELQALRGIGGKRAAYFKNVFTFDETPWK
jgi:competence ComEA-like helix-hairpin-helix protein